MIGLPYGEKTVTIS